MTGKSQVLAVTKPGCPACEQTKPAISKAKSKVVKKVRFAEVDAERHPSAVQDLGVRAFPDFVYKNKEGVVHHMPWSGVPSATSIVRWVDDVRQGKTGDIGSVKKNECLQCGHDGQGVAPGVWGPPLWFVIHMVALMYPSAPSAAQRAETIAFFEGLQAVLPCAYCQKHFAKELSTMDRAAFKNRDSLFEWTVRFHDSVSERTHSSQPRHGVLYWRKYYKRLALRSVRARKPT